jgi:DNA-binding IclR family transcriptional regulator
MGQLAAETGQTTHLAVWDGRRLMFLARKLGRRGLDQPHARAGSRLLAHCTASGKVLLAGRPWDEVIERVGANDGDALDFRTPRSVRDMRRLRGELDRVRECGIGYNVGETDLDVAAMAVPVHDATGQAVVALGITVALSEFTSFRARYEPLLRSMGQTLTRHLVTADRGRLRPVGASAVEWAPTAPETRGSIKVAG